MFRLVCLITGYVFGLFNTSLALGKLADFDIRKQGSGNTGTTNMVRTKGWKLGMLVLLGDAFKAIIPMLLMSYVFGQRYADVSGALFMAYTGLGAALGHNYPFYTGFRGGKGIATSLGIAFAYHPVLGLFAMGCFSIPFFTTHYASLSSMVMTIAIFVPLILATAYLRSAPAFTLPSSQAVELYVIFGLLIFLAFFRHRENIGRLLKGQERKTYLTKKDPNASG